MRTISTQVLVSSGQKNLLEERMKVCNMLWNARIPVSQPLKLFFMILYILIDSGRNVV